MIHRIAHYFRTYKMVPGKENKVTIGEPYGFDRAAEVIAASMADYDQDYGYLQEQE